MKKYIFFFLRYSGIPWLIRQTVQRNVVTMIYYHEPPIDVFDKHIKVLKQKFNIISLQDYLENKSQKKRRLIISIDDGHKSNYGLLPILKRNNVIVTIFITSGIVCTNRHFWFRILNLENSIKHELKIIKDSKRLSYLKEQFDYYDNKEYSSRQALSCNEMRELQPYVDFQSHTISHPCLNQCSNKKSFIEIRNSKLEIEDMLGKEVTSIAFPNGDYTKRELDYAIEANYKAVVTCDFGFNTWIDKPLLILNRISVNDTTDINELIVRASGLWYIIRKYSKLVRKNK